MKTIQIQNEATIKAEGKYNSKHCKPVMCIKSDGSELRSFSSVWDAASELDINAGYISTCMSKGALFKGYKFFGTKDAASFIGEIVAAYNSNANDASSYRTIKAEERAAREAEERRLEEERKAKAEHDAAVEKARAKIAKHTENCNKLESKLLEEERKLMQAEIELETLLGDNAQHIS